MTENSGVTDAPPLDRFASGPRRLPLPTEWTGGASSARYGAVFVLVAMIAVFVIIEPSTFATKQQRHPDAEPERAHRDRLDGIDLFLAAGDFDLSIGYVPVSAVCSRAGFIQWDGLAIPIVIVLVMAVGAIVGLTNGLIVTRIGVNPLVTTLGVGTIVVGINYAVTGGDPVAITNPMSFLRLTFNKLLGVPYPVYVMFGVAILLWVVLNRTVTGQSMQAVGGNAVAARLSGIRVDRVRMTAFVIAGVCAGVTGILLTSLGQGASDGGGQIPADAHSPRASSERPCSAMASSTSSAPSSGFSRSIGFNAIALIGLATYYQFLFQGALLIVGVGVGTFARRRAQA